MRHTKPNKKGSGWHGDKKRHSDARKYGKAGGKYAERKKVNISSNNRKPMFKKVTSEEQLGSDFNLGQEGIDSINDYLTEHNYDEKTDPNDTKFFDHLNDWQETNSGHDLCDSETNETIRPATWGEYSESLDSGPEGHIKVNGRRVYVRW